MQPMRYHLFSVEADKGGGGTQLRSLQIPSFFGILLAGRYWPTTKDKEKKGMRKRSRKILVGLTVLRPALNGCGPLGLRSLWSFRDIAPLCMRCVVGRPCACWDIPRTCRRGMSTGIPQGCLGSRVGSNGRTSRPLWLHVLTRC